MLHESFLEMLSHSWCGKGADGCRARQINLSLSLLSMYFFVHAIREALVGRQQISHGVGCKFQNRRFNLLCISWVIEVETHDADSIGSTHTCSHVCAGQTIVLRRWFRHQIRA